LISVDNLDKFRETYGFVASDDVLRAVSLMINNAIQDIGSSTDFVGQFSPTEFILLSTSVSLTALNETIGTRLAQSLDYFYPLKDRDRKDFPKGERLSVRVKQLTASQGPFINLNNLKAELSRRSA
jgi:GGDEF domain-containing protein